MKLAVIKNNTHALFLILIYISYIFLLMFILFTLFKI